MNVGTVPACPAPISSPVFSTGFGQPAAFASNSSTAPLAQATRARSAGESPVAVTALCGIAGDHVAERDNPVDVWSSGDQETVSVVGQLGGRIGHEHVGRLEKFSWQFAAVLEFRTDVLYVCPR